MASNSKTFSFRHEGHMFFIYDHKKKTEEDDPKDAILYFYPRSVTVDDQVALVGGIIGLADFCLEFIPQCVPSIIKLSGYNFALLQHENFIIGLADSPDVPDKFLISHMNFVWSTFMLYQGSLEAIRERVLDANFLKELNRVWDMYLPLCQIQGDLLSQAFQVLPYVQLHKSQGNLFLHASHILQRCLRFKGVIAGALFNRNKVLCTQLNNNLTRQLLLLMSHSQFPCVEADSSLELPGGVRLLYIFLPENEFASIGHRRKKSYLQKTSEGDDNSKKPTNPVLLREENSSSGVIQHNNNKKSSCVEFSSTPTSSLGGTKLPVSPTATIASGTDSEVYMDTLSDFDTHQPEKTREQQKNVDYDPINKSATYRLLDDIQSEAKSNKEETSSMNIPLEISENEFLQGQNLSLNDNTPEQKVKDNNYLILNTNDTSSEDPQLSCSASSLSFPVECETLPVKEYTIHVQSATDNITDGFEKKGSEDENALLKISPAVAQSADSQAGQISQSTSANILFEINNQLLDSEITRAIDVNDGTWADASETLIPTVDVQEQIYKSTIPFHNTGKESSDVKNNELVDSKVDSDEQNSSSNCYNSSTSNEYRAKYEPLINERDSSVLSDELEKEKPSIAQDCTSQLISGDHILTSCQVEKEDTSLILNDSCRITDASLEMPLSCEDTQSPSEYGSKNYEESLLSIADVDKISASRDRLIFEVQYSENSEGDIISPVSDLSRLSPVQELTGDESLSISLSDVQLRSHSAASDSRGSSQGSQLNAILLNCGLREVLVYAQGHSDTLLVLLLSRSAKCGKSYINSLWKSCLSHLAELDFEVKDAERHLKDEAENIGASFQYIKYDSFTQSLKGSALLPVTSLANEIVDSSVKMHESFADMPDLQEITYRSHSASCFGRRSISSETYFQLGLSPSAAGICSPDDKTFSLEQIGEKVLQKEVKISML